MSKQLSPNFNEAEFRCPCCGIAAVQPSLITALEDLRAKLGKPITINHGGGYRCAKHNAEIGGAPRSQHLLGMAADISSRNVSGKELYECAMTVPAFHGLGMAPTWIHCDVRPAPLVRWLYTWTGKTWAQTPWKD